MHDRTAERIWLAEWEPQAAIWLSWPHNQETWPGRFEFVEPAFEKFVATLTDIIRVRILVDPACMASAKKRLASLQNVELHACPTNDCWIRDYGPTIVREGDRQIGIQWGYNAWGGKYAPWDEDAKNAERVCQFAGIEVEKSPLVCEGGALETDGRRRLLTTPDCLITESRNPGWSQDDVAQELHRKLGIQEILWLDGGGLQGDDTDGHIDQIARFVDVTNVVCAVCDDSDDPNHEPLEQNYLQLRVWGRDTEPQVNIHRLPIPPKREIQGQRVPESYCNFLLVAGSHVILPQFNAPESDAFAKSLFEQLMPEWKIVPLDASDLVWGLGAFHCASQQQPLHRPLQICE